MRMHEPQNPHTEPKPTTTKHTEPTRGPVELVPGEYEAPRLVKDHAEGVYVGLLVVGVAKVSV